MTAARYRESALRRSALSCFLIVPTSPKALAAKISVIVPQLMVTVSMFCVAAASASCASKAMTRGLVVKQAPYWQVTPRLLAALCVNLLHVYACFLANRRFLRARMRCVASDVPSWKLPNQRSIGISSDP